MLGPNLCFRNEDVGPGEVKWLSQDPTARSQSKESCFGVGSGMLFYLLHSFFFLP